MVDHLRHVFLGGRLLGVVLLRGRGQFGQELGALAEQVDLGLVVDFAVLECQFVYLLEVLVDQVHVLLVEGDVDQAEQFDLFVGLDEFVVQLVDVAFELRVEAALDDVLVVFLLGRRGHHQHHDLPLQLLVLPVVLVGLVQLAQELLGQFLRLAQVEVQVEYDVHQRHLVVHAQFVREQLHTRLVQLRTVQFIPRLLETGDVLQEVQEVLQDQVHLLLVRLLVYCSHHCVEVGEGLQVQDELV